MLTIALAASNPNLRPTVLNRPAERPKTESKAEPEHVGKTAEQLLESIRIIFSKNENAQPDEILSLIGKVVVASNEYGSIGYGEHYRVLGILFHTAVLKKAMDSNLSMQDLVIQQHARANAVQKALMKIKIKPENKTNETLYIEMLTHSIGKPYFQVDTHLVQEKTNFAFRTAPYLKVTVSSGTETFTSYRNCRGMSVRKSTRDRFIPKTPEQPLVDEVSQYLYIAGHPDFSGNAVGPDHHGSPEQMLRDKGPEDSKEEQKELDSSKFKIWDIPYPKTLLGMVNLKLFNENFESDFLEKPFNTSTYNTSTQSTLDRITSIDKYDLPRFSFDYRSFPNMVPKDDHSAGPGPGLGLHPDSAVSLHRRATNHPMADHSAAGV